MTTKRLPKTGYWRINPETREAEWIEGSYQPPKPQPIEMPDFWIGEEPLPVPAIVPPEQPLPTLTPDYELLYKEYQRTGGKLTPETWLSIGAPLRPELETTLRTAYPEMFDPTRSFGFTEEQLPEMVIGQLALRMTEDYENFLQDLTARVGRTEAENILREFGVGEEFILQGLDVVEQEQRTLGIIQSVLPEIESIESFVNMVETDWESFFETIRTGGMNVQKRQLLELIGFNPQQINEIAMRPRLEVEVDGATRLLDIDLRTNVAYDLIGNYIGMFNPATREFTKAPRKTIIKQTLDNINFASLGIGKNLITFTAALMKDFFYRDIPADKSKRTPIEKLFSDDMVASINAMNTGYREQWEEIYAENEASYQDWLGKHPEIIPSVLYQEGAFQHPELLKDPNYIVYEIASMIPIVATIVASSYVGGAPLAILGMGAVEGGALYSELIDAGAPPDKAIEMAAIGGAVIGSLEYVGRIPLLKRLNVNVFGQFKREAIRDLARQGLGQTIKRFGRTFTIMQFSESLTEVAQEVVSNVAVRVYDESRSVFENLPDIFVKTMIATLPYSLFGAGVDVRMVKPSELSGLSDIEKRAKGWLKDAKGNWFAAVEEFRIAPERGAMIPGAPIGREPSRVTAPIPKNPEVVGKQISEALDVRYDGVQEGVGLQFTDPQTGSTTYGNTLEEARTNLENMRAKFAEVTPAPEVTELTADVWANMTTVQRLPLVRAKGLDSSRALINWEGLTIEERSALTGKPEVAIPTGVTPKTWAEGILAIAELSKETQAVTAPKPSARSIREAHKILGDIPVRQRMPKNLKDYINRIRNVNKKQYARDYAEWVLRGEVGVAPRMPLEKLGFMAQQSVEIEIRDRLKAIAIEIKPEPVVPKAEAAAVEEAPAVAEVPVIEEAAPTGEKIPSAITEAPPPTEGATARVFSRIQTEPAETGFIEKIKQGWHKFNIKMVDDLDPIKRIVDQLNKGDIQLSIDENPYLLARLLRGVTSKATTFLEYGTFGKNFYKVDKQGRASPNYTGESLQNILNEVKDPVKWRDFSTYLTARRAVELSARDIETGIEVADARASIIELEAKYPQFEGLAQRVYKYQDGLLVYAQEMGLLSKEMLGKLRKYGNYVPFYRVFNELQAKGLFGKKMANIPSPIKRIKGSEREIINPLESIVKNTYVLVNAADRNQVGIAIANLVDKNPELADVFERVKTPIARVAQVSAKELGVEVEGLTEAEEEQMVDIFRPSFFVRGDEVTVLIDGKKHYYRVDADLRDSLLRLDRESLGLLGKWLGAPARWLRAGATLSPDFMFRNPARDQLTAFAYSNYGFMPGVDWLKGLASIVRKDADYQLFRMSGAEHSMLVSMDRSYLQKTFKQIVEGKGFTEYVKHPMELFRIISELGEKATRLGEFKKGIQSGAVPLEAGYSARSVTLDFSQAGTTAQAINTFIAFFNANVRGWGRMISSFKEQPIRTSAKVFIGITLPSILLWAVNHDDDRWKEIPQWQKDLFWIIFVGDNIYRIPKPFELGILFGSVPERFLDWLVDKDPDLMKDLAQSIMEAGSPGFIPTAGLPIIEWMTNYSFFRGRAIVPKSRQAMPPELQYTPWTSEVSKKLGELLKLPPAQLDNLMFAWTGGLGRYATDILDGILKGTGISPDIPEPSPTLADLPVIKAFVVRNPYGSSSEAVNDFYNFLEKYEAGEKYLKEMLINGELEKFDKYKAAHPELFFFADFDSERYREAIEKGETPKDVFYSSSARYLRRVANELSELSKKEDLIYKDPDMSPEEKRRLIDEIEILKTDIARKAVDLLQQKEPPILQERINEVVGKLGQVIEEGTPLSLEKPDIFTIPDAYREFDSILEGATEAELKALEGINPLALAYIKKEEIEKTLEPILNKQVKDIDFNLKEGVSFEDYYKQWQLGLVKDSPLDKISRRQVELLRKYETSDAKKAFLKSLTDNERTLLNENPQEEWLISHPTENAEWALAGKAKLLTRKAYAEFQRLIKELDIPDSAIPEMTLPPETSIDTHFTYEDMVSAGTHGSWEAQLLLKQDAIKAEEAGVQSYADWRGLKLSDSPLASLEIKTKPEYRQIYDKIQDLSDNTSPDYIADEKARAEAIKKLKTQDYIDDTRRIEAIEKGTDENPIDEELVNAHVAYGKLIDQEGIGSSSAEAMLYRVDNPDYDAFRTDTAIWDNQALTPIDESRIPIWRIDVKYAKEDEEYNAIKNSLPAEQARLRTEYMASHPEYRMDNRRREAYSLTNSATGEKFPLDQVENYVAYYEYGDKGFRRERFLIENPDFASAMHRVVGIDLPDPAKVPSVEYDNIYDEWQDDFIKWEGLGDNTSEFYVEDPVARQQARDSMLYTAGKQTYSGVTITNKVLTGFGLAQIKRDAYGQFVPEQHIDNYVQWRKIQSEGKPADWESITKQGYWFEDDWFLMENQDFYRDVYLGLFKNERKDFRKVPDRLVFEKYLIYVKLPHQTAKKEYRAANPDLEEWGILRFDWIPIKEQERRAGLTPTERFLEELYERQREIEERLEALR